MPSLAVSRRGVGEDAAVVPYARFLERQAWRAKIASDRRTLEAAAVNIAVAVHAWAIEDTTGSKLGQC